MEQQTKIKQKSCKIYSISYKASHELSHVIVAVLAANSKAQAWDIFLSEYAMGYDVEDLRCHKEDISEPTLIMSDFRV